ncbi:MULTISPECIES: class I SAM-dependent methyltransferase [Dyella]|uniref:class I SAM-dependent methyltransferase n=1 Tax=Dyella TaxID=231454 RepID=UPI000C82D5B3|nr:MULTISPECIES: methyltransferase domain-containing protein [Dyella]MDR3443768.1 methyltransferase domain-containing protein [Dyella sp.]PMQ03337.1 Magnesium-protoporphyrin O-methyltransferase [Dyella sp. AD56]ULU23679.1 methyltransferase domain-containing protein [Dyella terrae]
MQVYATRNEQLSIGGHTYRLRVLSDKQQFSDPKGHRKHTGLSATQWGLFGQLWPSERLLAQAMHRFALDGKRILELGCGIGLACLVLKRRGADIVASDVHPLAKSFLSYNAALNALPTVDFHRLPWDAPELSIGRFDAIIASDVLYESAQARLLAEVVKRHAYPSAEVVITDPGSDHSQHFTQLLAEQHFVLTEERCPMDDRDTPPYRGNLLHYIRGGEPSCT